MTNVADAVADAWRNNRPMGNFRSVVSANCTRFYDTMHTDGRTVQSYNTIIGYTTEDGFKVAINCQVSHTTARHTKALAIVADRVTSCLCPFCVDA